MPRLFPRTLAAVYFFAAGFHVLDLFDLRLRFSEMDVLWRIWTIYLIAGDLLAAAALWWRWRYGEMVFILVALSQISVFLGWSNHFGNQYPRLIFHLCVLSAYLVYLTHRQNVAGEP